jgi:molybdopterin synthase sulfur carrier subunit
MVTLLYFARLRESLGLSSEQVELPPQVNDLRTLIAWLGQRGEHWRLELSGNSTVRMAINQNMASADAAVKDGDEIAFFPPVTGG